MSFGPLEILVLLIVLGLIVGPSRISRMVRSLGRGAYDFIDELGGDKKDKDGEKPDELEPGKNQGGREENHRERG